MDAAGPWARTTWRLLVCGPQDPAWNMAVDEALLEGMDAAPGPPVLRLYRWRPAAVSLGRFQPAADAAGRPPGTALVRRVTGGAAILHREDEVTYAVVAPYALVGDGRPRTAYRAIHGLLARALAALGVPLEAERGLAAGAPADPGRAPLRGRCYAAATDYDLAVGGRKLVGSAQRRRGRAFLQHGCVPSTPDPDAPAAVALADLLPVVPPPEAVEAAIVDALHAVAARVDRSALTAAERDLAGRIRDARTACPSWVMER